MSFLDILGGALWVILIMLVAGGVAYVGDRVGHQVGRKRLTLFGIRPRYTSTIVAVGTGMLIALVVTLAAIFASENVKTAFFKLSQINQQISDLQSRERELERKVTTGQLVVATDTLLVPFLGYLPRNDDTEERMRRVRAFYDSAVGFMNANLTPRGLRHYGVPPDIDKRLTDVYDSPAMTALLSQTSVVLLVSADQNLYVNDPIHFSLDALPDTRRFAKGQIITELRNIPAGPNANPNLAFSELMNLVTIAGRTAQLPAYLATNVVPVEVLPTLQQMDSMLKRGSGSFVMTAYAAQDIYPHTAGIPVIVTLTRAK
jgi:hypothetical protein